MIHLIRKGYYIKSLRSKLQLFTKRCVCCVKNKTTLKQALGHLGRLGPVLYPFDVISIDTKGGFKNLKSPRKYLHLAIDHFTRKVWHLCSKGYTEKDLINLIREVLKIGKPKVILCDLYSAMKGNTFKKFVLENDIKLLYTCTDSPESNFSPNSTRSKVNWWRRVRRR